MKKLLCIFGFLLLVFFLGINSYARAERETLVIDDFEDEIISSGPDATIDAGTGNGSYLNVSGDQEIKKSGKRSLKIEYDAISGGYMWIARGFGLDVKGADKWLLKPQDIGWDHYAAISFYMYGSGNGARIAFDIKDNGGEMFRYMITDDFKGWKLISCHFKDFLPRGDWQPPTADVNGTLDFPVKSYQFEPIAVSKGKFNIDEVRLEVL